MPLVSISSGFLERLTPLDSTMTGKVAFLSSRRVIFEFPRQLPVPVGRHHLLGVCFACVNRSLRCSYL